MIQKDDLIYFRAGTFLFRNTNIDMRALENLIEKKVINDIHSFFLNEDPKCHLDTSTSDIIAQCIYSYRLEYTTNKYFMIVAIVIDTQSNEKLLIMSPNAKPEILIKHFDTFNE